MTGIIQEMGLTGILEASDYDALDFLSFVFGAILDVLCGNLESAEVMKSYPRYVDLVNFIYFRGEKPGWDGKGLTKLKKMIRMFKNHSRLVIDNYHLSRMATLKRHGLDNLPEELRHIGGSEYLNGSLYERSHRFFIDILGRPFRRTLFATHGKIRTHD